MKAGLATGGAVILIVAIFILLSIKAVEYHEKHEEAWDSCYELAKYVAKDRNVQLAMSDGFLSEWECRNVVEKAWDQNEKQTRMSDFMNAAREP